MSNKIRFTVEFDSAAWDSLNESERSEWIDAVTRAINDAAYVSTIEHV